MADLPQYATVKELAERYHVVPATVRSWSAMGRGPRSIRVNGRRLFPADEVMNWEAKKRCESGIPAHLIDDTSPVAPPGADVA